MCEVPGSIPGISKQPWVFLLIYFNPYNRVNVCPITFHMCTLSALKICKRNSQNMARLRESAILIAPQETQMKNYACHIYLHKMTIPNFLMNSFWEAETCGEKETRCIGRESNPGLPRGRREFYHWTTNALVEGGFPHLTRVNLSPCNLFSVNKSVKFLSQHQKKQWSF